MFSFCQWQPMFLGDSVAELRIEKGSLENKNLQDVPSTA